MTRGRKALPAVQQEEQVNNEAVQSAQNAAGERATHLLRVEEQFGDGEPYSYQRAVAEGRFFIGQGNEAYMQGGRRLIMIKEHEEHGRFMAALETIGIAPRTASRMMLIAATFSNRPALADLGRTKVAALAALDDVALDALEAGGSYADLTLTDLHRMSYREIEDALKEKDEENASLNELLADRTKDRDKWERKARKVKELQEWSDACAGVVADIEGIVKKMAPQLGALGQRVEELSDMVMEANPSKAEGKATALQVSQALNVLVNLLAPIQAQTQETFQTFVPTLYTGLYSPKE